MNSEDLSKSRLWNQLDWSNIEPPNFRQLENSISTLNLTISPISRLKHPNIHYRCPKCYNFPLINF